MDLETNSIAVFDINTIENGPYECDSPQTGRNDDFNQVCVRRVPIASNSNYSFEPSLTNNDQCEMDIFNVNNSIFPTISYVTADAIDNSETPPNLPFVNSNELLSGMSHQDILSLIANIPKLTEQFTNLEEKYSTLHDAHINLQNEHIALKTEHNDLRNEFVTLKKDTETRFNNNEQYSKRNSLIIKNLRNVPKKTHGINFSKYIARELNKLFPSLSERVTHYGIDASHILYNDGKNYSPVVIVKFISRDLRNEIFYQKDDILDTGVSITEHLTGDNFALYTQAKLATSEAWTDQCKVFAVVKGKKKLIKHVSDLSDVNYSYAASDDTNTAACSTSSTPPETESYLVKKPSSQEQRKSTSLPFNGAMANSKANKARFT